ncbi:MAG: TonB family protein [Bdellovibrionales bacterium]|nr:TonB family protein [Bdellovibrionales bacterium]
MPRKKMNFLGPMGLSIIAHGAVVVGVGYMGLQSVQNKGENVSEMEIGTEQTAAPAESVVPLEVAADAQSPAPEAPAREIIPAPPEPAPVVAPSPKPIPVAKAEPIAQPQDVPSAVVVPPAPKVIEKPVEPEPESPQPPVAAAAIAPPEETMGSEAAPTEAETSSANEVEPPAPLPMKSQKASEETGGGESQAADGEGVDSQNSSAVTPGIPDGVISDSQLSPIQTARPEYPLAEKMKGHQGDVILLYSLRGDGSVGNIRIFKSSGSKNLDLSAARALSQYKYPAGRTAEVIKTFSFRLKGPSVEAPSRWRK